MCLAGTRESDKVVLELISQGRCATKTRSAISSRFRDFVLSWPRRAYVTLHRAPNRDDAASGVSSKPDVMSKPRNAPRRAQTLGRAASGDVPRRLSGASEARIRRLPHRGARTTHQPGDGRSLVGMVNGVNSDRGTPGPLRRSGLHARLAALAGVSRGPRRRASSASSSS